MASHSLETTYAKTLISKRVHCFANIFVEWVEL